MGDEWAGGGLVRVREEGGEGEEEVGEGEN